MKFLIVADHPPMRQFIRSVVTEMAEAVSECADGVDVFAVYTELHLTHDDWVLMDLELSGTDAFEATKQLHTAVPDAQIIIVTQFDDAHLRNAATLAGACGYVLKENLLDLPQLISNYKDKA